MGPHPNSKAYDFERHRWHFHHSATTSASGLWGVTDLGGITGIMLQRVFRPARTGSDARGESGQASLSNVRRQADYWQGVGLSSFVPGMT